ncbi:hypothetical protein CDL15_Pgr025024 [Punica granatum]|uniref:Dirigent protein n=1 Tax=Punica granatum TaxID=22663 RepID=A0A218W7I0_PUNGR|nr:hypothetical protein CDL15_Pgr025024 [Punica granatum]PKI36392.1 hypothetical protein CRG98_043174 [Punica granatum]
MSGYASIISIYKSNIPSYILFIQLLVLATSSSLDLVSTARTLAEDEQPFPAVVPALPGAVQTLTGPVTPVSSEGDAHVLTFFMHDILGGSNPSALAVTGIVTNPAVTAQVPFAKPNGANIPINTGVPQSSGNSGLINNNNNVPFLTGLSGTTGNLVRNNGNGTFIGGGPRFPVLNGGQLPKGMTLQKMMFGTITVLMTSCPKGMNSGHAL